MKSKAAQPMLHYWLVAGQVHYTTAAASHRRNLNTMVSTKPSYFSRADLGRSQQVLQARLMKDTFPNNHIPSDLLITDVFVISVSQLGQMTRAEFEKGYEALLAEGALN